MKLKITVLAVLVAVTPQKRTAINRAFADAGYDDETKEPEKFRSMLIECSTARYAAALPYRHWGINE